MSHVQRNANGTKSLPASSAQLYACCDLQDEEEQDFLAVWQ
jgi:hypothetical protein